MFHSLRLEMALRDDGYEYGLPYWNSGLDYPLPDVAHSAIFMTSELGVSLVCSVIVHIILMKLMLHTTR